MGYLVDVRFNMCIKKAAMIAAFIHMRIGERTVETVCVVI